MGPFTLDLRQATSEGTPQGTGGGRSPGAQVGAVAATSAAHAAVAPFPRNTLQHSREQVALRWPALRELARHPGFARCAATNPTQEDAAVCVLLSLAGGVGKTTLAAALAQALTATGERVQLVDFADHGVLAYHFAGQSGAAGQVVTQNPRPDEATAPELPNEPERVQASDPAGTLQHQVMSALAAPATVSGLTEAQFASILDHCRARGERLVVDGGSLESLAAKPWFFAQLLERQSLFLVPVAPDMASVISLQAVEQRLWALATTLPGANGAAALRVRFILNQFESSQALHLDVRHVLDDLLGEGLLPIAIRRSPLVAEALAEHMTALQYAPKSEVAADYRALADWVRSLPAGRQRGSVAQAAEPLAR